MWVLHLFAPLLFSFIFLRAIKPLRCGVILKIFFALLTALGCFKLEISRLFGGPRFFSPDFPAWVLIAMTWAYSITFLLFPFFLAGDICKGLYLAAATILKHKPDADQYRTYSNRINLAILVLVIAMSTFGTISGLSDPLVKKIDVEISNLPAEAEGTTLALMADLHADAVTDKKRIATMVEITNSLHPDTVVIVGDFVDGSVLTRAEQLSPLTNLISRFGTFAVPGNHDYYSGFTTWKNQLAKFKVNMLVNKHVVLPNGLVIAGVADIAANRMYEEEPDIEKAIMGTPSGKAAVLLAHNPSYALTASKYDIGIQLSGHTHGGIGPGFDRIVAACNAGFVRGLYTIRDMQIYVSPGTGIWNGFPLRLFNPPEITLITLHNKD